MRSLSFLIKPASSICNLRCKYCFYADEAENRMRPSAGVMTEATADLLLDEAYSTIDRNGYISFMFQGGEPTAAGLPFFRHFAAKAREKKPPRVQISFAIQTNGTLLNDEWAEFLREEGFLVGLSIDGFKDAHDLYRLDAAGKGTWNRVLRASQLLTKHHVEYNALCVVTGRVARSPELTYRTLKKLGFRYMQFIACLDPIGPESGQDPSDTECRNALIEHIRGEEPYSLTPAAYGTFLCDLFDLWYRDWQNGDYHSVRLFEDYVHILLGDNASTCATCGRCGSYLVVEGDGSLYPCDFFALDKWLIGKLGDKPLTELADGEVARAFLQWGTEKPAECTTCRYSGICNGGCKNDWFADESGVHNYYCSAFTALLDHAIDRMQKIALAERRMRGR